MFASRIYVSSKSCAQSMQITWNLRFAQEYIAKMYYGRKSFKKRIKLEHMRKLVGLSQMMHSLNKNIEYGAKIMIIESSMTEIDGLMESHKKKFERMRERIEIDKQYVRHKFDQKSKI